MEISIVPHVSPALPPMIPGGHATAYEPLATTRAAQPISGDHRELVALDDGGVALGLDPCDDSGPHWLAWNEWVDARQACAVAQPVSNPRELVALEDGGVALGLDPCDGLAPQWLAWDEWVDARQACLAAAPRDRS